MSGRKSGVVALRYLTLRRSNLPNLNCISRVLTYPLAAVPNDSCSNKILSSFREVDETPKCTVDQLHERKFERVRCAKDGQSFRWFCLATTHVHGDLFHDDTITFYMIHTTNFGVRLRCSRFESKMRRTMHKASLGQRDYISYPPPPRDAFYIGLPLLRLNDPVGQSLILCPCMSHCHFMLLTVLYITRKHPEDLNPRLLQTVLRQFGYNITEYIKYLL